MSKTNLSKEKRIRVLSTSFKVEEIADGIYDLIPMGKRWITGSALEELDEKYSILTVSVRNGRPVVTVMRGGM